MARRAQSKTRRSQTRLGEQPQVAPEERPIRSAESMRLLFIRLPGLLLIVVGLLMLRHLATEPHFTVTEVEVKGANLLTPESVRGAVQLTGRNVFRINQGKVERQLLSAYACLEGAEVVCRLPGRCQVRLDELSDVLVWEQGDQSWWVDLDGRMLGLASVATNAPTLHNIGTAQIPEDGYLPGVPWAFAAEVSEVLEDEQELEFMRGYGLVLHLGEDRLPVYLGVDGDAVTKLSLAEMVVAEAGQRGLDISYIDLRSEKRPVVGGL